MTTVARGREFEHRVHRLLISYFNSNTTITGQRNDQGIDMISDLVICQCKIHKITPAYVRELEGVLTRYPNHLGILATENGYSTLSLSRVYTSTRPLSLIHFKGNDIVSFKFNRLARDLFPKFTSCGIARSKVDGKRSFFKFY